MDFPLKKTLLGIIMFTEKFVLYLDTHKNPINIVCEKLSICQCWNYWYLKLLLRCTGFKTPFILPLLIFCLETQTFCLVMISQPFIFIHSVGKCVCRFEERKLGINEKIEISCKVMLNTEIEFNMVLLTLLLRFPS